MDELIVCVVACIVIFGSLITIGVFADRHACHAQWDHAGMKSVEWGPIEGCIVELPDGRKMPTDAIKELPSLSK